MATLAPFWRAQFFDGNGNPLAAGLLYTYDSGTTTPKLTWTGPVESVPTQNTNPIVLDSTGSCDLWLSSTGAYTLRLETSGAVLVDTIDNVTATPLSTSGSFLPLSGGTLTGALTLPGNATAALQAVPLQQLNSAIAGSTPTAASVSIADAGNYYTGTNVEAALQEAAQLPGRLLSVQVFTSNGTWNRPAGCTRVMVEAIGGGGGSGVAGTTSASGGAGGYSRRFITSPGTSESVTVGAGGAVNAAGAASLFGAFVTANGGGAGGVTDGGLGGTASGGDVNITGAPGNLSFSTTGGNNFYGPGGSGPFGGGAVGGYNRTNGVNGGANTGGGGSGGSSTGGTGGSGIVIVHHYT